MMVKAGNNIDRLHELLADRALHPLPAPDAGELEHLLAAHPDVDGDEMDLAAALLAVAFESASMDPIPANLRMRLESDAVQFAARSAGLRFQSSESGDAPASKTAIPPLAGPLRRAPRRSAWMPWLLAAAAWLIALLAWWPSSPAPTPLPLSADRQALLDGAADVIVLPWATAPEGVSGDVVWSTARQEGYARFTGLAANDASNMQYQLWVGDASRESDVAGRVDGGVFDIVEQTNGEVIVRITPRLPVIKPSLFAVTTEKPGGVIVSDLSGLIIAAPVEI